MAIRLGLLLKDAYRFCVSHWQTILIGAVLFGTLSAILLAVSNKKVEMGMLGSMERMGLNQQEMMDLQVRIQAGDEAAMAEAQAKMEEFGEKLEGMSDEERGTFFATEGMAMFRKMLPVMGIGLLISILIGTAAQAYFLLLALGKGKDAIAILNGVPKLFLPLLGVWLWSVLRSFIWIPILGLIPAIILGPRFLLAPIILVREGKGVLESVQSSYVRTSGYWGKIIGNLIVVALVCFLAMIVLGLLSPVFSMIAPVISLWYGAVVKQVASAFMVVFAVALAKTIMEHPMKS